VPGRGGPGGGHGGVDAAGHGGEHAKLSHGDIEGTRAARLCAPGGNSAGR
jgi:hypothetical protein